MRALVAGLAAALALVGPVGVAACVPVTTPAVPTPAVPTPAVPTPAVATRAVTGSQDAKAETGRGGQAGPDGDVQWDGLKHDSFSAGYRAPFGAVPTGTTVTLRFRTVPLDVTAVSVRVSRFDTGTGRTEPAIDVPMRYQQDRTEDGRRYAIWSAQLSTPRSPSILWYAFRVEDGTDVDWYSDDAADAHDNLRQGGTGAVFDDEPSTGFQLTVYDRSFRTPSWLREGAVYQVFPDRFRNGTPANDYCRAASTVGCPTFYGTQRPRLHATWNEPIGDPYASGPDQGSFGTQFFGGDLQGLTARLDYVKDLGFDVIYLNPVFAARSNHRYDTDDFRQVDPALGGDAAFAELAKAARARGIRLVLDGVFNHASSDSRYFDRYHRYPSDGACESATSPYRSWFLFRAGTVPCGSGDYEDWAGYDSLAVFDDVSAGVRDFFFRAPGNVTEYWYKRGAAGWRFDVANEISHDWWRAYRVAAKRLAADGPLIGEVWDDASAFLAGDQLDSVMNYRFRKNVLGFARGVGWRDNDNNGGNEIVGLTPSALDRAMTAVREDYPPQAHAAMLNLLDSHDTNRALQVLTLLGDSGLRQAKERLRMSALLQFSYPGVPMVYYGDEAGLHSPSRHNGDTGPQDDPYNRAPYPWPDAGGDQTVYGPVDPDLLTHYRRLGALRRGHPALRTGSFATVLTGDTTTSGTDDGTYAFVRVSGRDAVLVAVNNSGAANRVSLPVAGAFGDGTRLVDALAGGKATVVGGAVRLTIPARSGVALVRR